MALVETAKFPAAVASESDMLNWRNMTPSETVPTLSVAMTNTDTTATLVAGTGAFLPTDNFVISIDDEIMFVGTRSTDSLSGIVRAYEGTTAAAHSAAAQVTQNVTAKSHNQLVSEINAIETQLGANLRNVRRAKLTVVAYSATPTFDASGVDAFQMTITGNVTSSTLSNLQDGQFLTFIIKQDSVGGHSFAWPSSISGGMAVDTTANAISVQNFVCWGGVAYATGPGTVN